MNNEPKSRKKYFINFKKTVKINYYSIVIVFL